MRLCSHAPIAALLPARVGQVAVVYLFSNFYLIESMARAEALTRRAEHKALQKEILGSQELGKDAGAPATVGGTCKDLQQEQQRQHRDELEDDIEPDPAYVLDSRKFEMSQLAAIFLGPVGSWTFTVTFALYQYSALFSNARECVFAV